MRINNPGILDGSVTTAKIADGAVTTAKCNTTDFAPAYTSDAIVKGTILSQLDSEPTVALENASGVFHWSFDEYTHDGTFQYAEIYDGVNGRTVLKFNTDGSITLFSPLAVADGGTGSATAGSNIPSALPVPVADGGTGSTTAGSNIPSALPVPTSDGGTGAASLLAAGIPQVVADTGLVTGNTTEQTPTVYAAAPAGTYLVCCYVQFSSGTGGPYTSSVSVQGPWQGSNNDLFLHENVQVTNAEGLAGSALLNTDASGNITAALGTATSGGDTFEYRVVVLRVV